MREGGKVGTKQRALGNTGKDGVSREGWGINKWEGKTTEEDVGRKNETPGRKEWEEPGGQTQT